MYTHTQSKFLPSFSLAVFVFFVARKICKETTLSDRHQKYRALTISTLHKADLPSNFPGIITVVNVSHGMYTAYLILQPWLLPLVAVAVLGFLNSHWKFFEYCWLQSSSETPDKGFRHQTSVIPYLLPEFPNYWQPKCIREGSFCLLPASTR